MCTFTWWTLNMVQKLVWGWRLYESKHVATFIIDNKLVVFWLNLLWEYLSENTSWWLQLRHLQMLTIFCILDFKFSVPVYYYYYYYYHHHHHHHHHHHYFLHAGYLYIYSWDKPCPLGIQCFSYSVIIIYGAYIASSCVGSIVLLR